MNDKKKLKKLKNNHKNSPLKGKYLVKNPLLYFFLKCVEIFSFFYFKLLKIVKLKFLKFKFFQKDGKKNFEHEKMKFDKNPKKILLSNIAHLGDVLISLKAVIILKQKYPEIKIGFICSSPSKQIVEKFSLIDKIFTVDHWKINREKISKFKKFRKYLGSRKMLIDEIRKEKYDVAIDLHYYFPNSIYLLYKAKIPMRVSYSSAGFENFLTHSLIWKNKNQHVSLYHLDLLKFLNIDQNFIKVPTNVFTKEFVDKHSHCNKKNQIKYQKNDQIKNQNKQIKLEKFNLPDDYIIIHIGAGSEKKMWDISKWKELVREILKKGKKIVFTGKGENEQDLINQIINSQILSKDKQNFADSEKYLFECKRDEKIDLYKNQLFNLCNKLNFSELSYIVKNATLVICVDSFMLHLATALDKPTIVIYSGINNLHWTEKKQNVIPVVKKLACNPCYLKNGCKSMDCLNNIKIEDILAKMESFECIN